MKRSFIAIAALALTAISAATPASATVCAITDISPGALDCSGFYSGNLLNGSPAAIAAQKSALAEIGFTWDGQVSSVEKIDALNGSFTVDFTTLLQGISYIGLHFGNGRGGPGNATAFYKIDAGLGLDEFTLAYQASSNAVLYATGLTSAVPEPATWAMLLTGFGLVGTCMRQRRSKGAVTHA